MTKDMSYPSYQPASPDKLAGIGLRSPHYDDVLSPAFHDKINWVEVHPENYFCGGIHRNYLAQARALYPLSLHGVGLSLGSDQPVSSDHLQKFKALIDIYEPFLISDHVSWSASGNAHLNDLLPLPYTHETLERLCDNISRSQDFFGRRILIENPSSYIAYQIDEMTEAQFINLAAQKTGCGILLDVNNIYVQSRNHGFDAYAYINEIKPELVQEMHLAGHIEQSYGPAADASIICLDTHNQPVRDEVWDLYRHAIAKIGPCPTLIEWDSDIPPLQTLIDQANLAQGIIDNKINNEIDNEK